MGICALCNWFKSLTVVTLLSAASFSLANEPIRVLSYNIRYDNPGDGEDRWENRSETVIATIQDYDLVGLQEVLASQQKDIQQETPQWQWLAVGRDDGMQRGEMVSIGWQTSKLIALEQGTFWLSEQPYRIGKPGWDAALPRIASWVRLVPRDSSASASASDQPPKTLLLINTHFDHRGREARRQSSALLRRWISENRKGSEVLLIGDFNAMLGSPPLEELLNDDVSDAPPLHDARQHSEIADDGPDSTWNAFKEIAPDRRIDHILFQGDQIRIQNFQTLDPRTPAGRFASDHLPIMAEIEF